MMPKAVGEIIGDMNLATGGRVPLLSGRTARERIPGIDPDQEDDRLREETKNLSQYAMEPGAETAGGAGSFGNFLGQAPADGATSNGDNGAQTDEEATEDAYFFGQGA